MFAHGQYFDACTNDRALKISLLHELPVAGGEFKLDSLSETARPGPGGESGRAWTVLGEIVASVALCMWALPWLPALGGGGIFTLFVWVIVTPLTRHTMYAPLLHLVVVFYLTSRLRGRESGFYLFHVAACIVYAHSAYRVRGSDSSHQRHAPRTLLAVSVGSLAVAVFFSSEALQFVNASLMALMMLMFSLRQM